MHDGRARHGGRSRVGNRKQKTGLASAGLFYYPQGFEAATSGWLFYCPQGFTTSVGIDRKGTTISFSLPNGAVLALGTTYGSALTVTAATNASPAVLSSAAHGLVNGDLVEVTSGWSKLNNRIFRVSASLTGTFALEGTDSSSTVNYPVGSGIGSVRKITAFTQVSQILETTSSGGDMGFTTVSFLENDFETQIPTQASAQSIAISIADDPTLPGYVAVKAAAETRTARALKVNLPNGSVILYNGIVSLDETPSLTKNQVMAVKSTFSLQGRPVRYAS